MSRNLRVPLMLVTLVVVALLATFWATTQVPMDSYWEKRMPPSSNIIGDKELFYTVQTVVSSVNVALLIILLIIYIDIFRKTKSEFTIGLLIFSMVLLLYALFSNPIIHWLFGFRSYGLGPFAMLPHIFTFVALTVLLYLTVRY
jgi:hypothetical protein